jgi:hypothetical protein
VRLLVLVSILIACKSDKPAADPVVKPQLPPLPTVAPQPTPPSPAAPIGWWRSDRVCLELHENGDFELAVMPPGNPKIVIVGAATTTRDGEQWKVALTPKAIWQSRYISSCRKSVISAKQLDHQDVLGVVLKPGETATATLQIGDDVKLCFADKCESLQAETPTLRGRWRLPRKVEAGKEETWPKGQMVQLDLGGVSYTWTLYTGNGGSSLDSVTGDQNSAVTLVGPDHYELTLGTRRFTATRLAGQHLELCEDATCATFDWDFDKDRTGDPCRE